MNESFIALEGIDGVGKTSLIESLKKMKPDLVTTREPGGTPYAEALRRLLFSEDGKKMTKEQQLRIFFEARRDHVFSLVMPSISSGKIVVSDRFDTSTFGYQRPDQNNLEEMFWVLREECVTKYLDPFYVWLQLDVDTAMKRESVSASHNHFDQVDVSVVESRLEGYQKFFSFKNIRHVKVDASGTPEQTLENFLKVCPLN
jgi:dTMP kinase